MVKALSEELVAVITGGGKGIGKSIAQELAKTGAHIVICARNEDDLKKVCEDIRRSNGKCDYNVVDVTSKQDVEKFVESVIMKYGRIDVLVNNAGFANGKKYIESVTDDEYENYFETNVHSVFYFLRKVIPEMKSQNSGLIINVSSQSGLHASPIMPIYSANKFAIEAFTEAVAKEFEESGCNAKCIAICPSGVNTEMRVKLFGLEDAKLQQSPDVVGKVVSDIVLTKIDVPNGANVHIRNGSVAKIDDVLYDWRSK
ncbi:MAG: SDR family oxidoreductase [Candidatus Aenigmarchaeota archaeon]|nr:SDR family oxidoreductase [Candidatus Aenigmarchaeota archaeon]